MAQFLVCTVPAVLWAPDNCHLVWMMAAVACGLAISSCAGTIWVERHSVPEACLSHPWVAWFWAVGLPLYGSVPCFAVPAVHSTLDSWNFLDDSHKCWCPGFSSWNSWPLSCVDIVYVCPVLLFSGLYLPTVGLIRGRMFCPSSLVPFS